MLENLNPFKGGSEESKQIPPPTTEEQKPSRIDTSVPMSHFTKEERAKMGTKGMSDNEIDMKERDVINNLTCAQSGKMAN